jgi:hypothetical protein
MARKLLKKYGFVPDKLVTDELHVVEMCVLATTVDLLRTPSWIPAAHIIYCAA